MNTQPLIRIFRVVFVDLLGFSIIPLLPRCAESFGASGGLIGLLLASYAMAQSFGAPSTGL